MKERQINRTKPQFFDFQGDEYFMQIQINVCMQYERFIKYKTIMEFKGLRRKKKN